MEIQCPFSFFIWNGYGYGYGIRWHPDKDLQYRTHLMIFVLHKHE